MKQPRLDRELSNAIIDALGGNARVAKELEISSQAVSHFRRLGLTLDRLKFLREKFRDLPVMQLAAVRDFRRAAFDRQSAHEKRVGGDDDRRRS